MEKEEKPGEFFKTAVLAIFLALVIRTFLFEPFNIPSGSMLPTLQIGDYLFVSKTSYGYSRHSFPFGLASFEGRVMEDKPQRGDVIVFKLPTNPSIDYIKRLIGMPGDKIQVKRGRLYINGEMVEREPVGMKRISTREGGKQNMMEYIETLPGGVMHTIYEESDSEPLDNTDVYVVPDGHYFMMGDNRDNSQDSRVTELVGYVPEVNLVGRAEILFFSIDESASIYKPWTWFSAIRYGRIFDRIGPARQG
ncbi:MAG: signal peptidase I [Micavibrio aeruginosavorus]|uniref:Signal peptidase I n=1 Tax=Micavibrio aeruginosavorus TaxID=349221 RepID=A0A2W4ZYX6_9BACT|nr:MAG: signal peptidase I [Micavibrio aeruginosavorus]